MTTKEQVQRVRELARELIRRLDAIEYERNPGTRDAYTDGGTQVAAAKRASMDLTRELAIFRGRATK